MLAGHPVIDLRGRLIVPGFVDTHIHYPQTEMIGAFGEQLLEQQHRILKIAGLAGQVVGTIHHAGKVKEAGAYRRVGC